MGINRSSADFLAGKCRDLALGGRVLTLGRQNIALDLWGTVALAAEYGLIPSRGDEVLLPPEHSLINMVGDGSAFCDYGLTKGKVADQAFFRLLGFESVESIDFSDFEGADHSFDLNTAPGSSELPGPYDFVYNGGTLEHVFHLPNALANAHDLLNVGGYIYHEMPCNNCVDHGFYQFSPTLLFDYYSANEYKIHGLYLVRLQTDTERMPYMWMEYRPQSLDQVSFGGLDAGIYFVIMLAQRLAHSTAHVIPQQGGY